MVKIRTFFFKKKQQHTNLSRDPRPNTNTRVKTNNGNLVVTVTYPILIPDVLECAQAPGHSVHHLGIFEVGQINKSQRG